MVVAVIPYSMDEMKEMLEYMGVSSWEELFIDIPTVARKDGINIPSMDEYELYRHAKELADKNKDFFHMPNFLGAGVYSILFLQQY